MLHFIVLLVSLFVLDARAGQYPALPNPNLTVQATNASHLVAIVGCRGIALADALAYRALGSTVVCTTRNTGTYNASQLAGTGVILQNLHLGARTGNRNHRGDRWMAALQRDYGKNPDVFIYSALDVTNGLPDDYTADEREYYYRQHAIDLVDMEALMLARFPHQRVTIVYQSTWAALVRPPRFQQLYNQRAAFLMDRAESFKVDPTVYPQAEWLFMACVFTKTDAMLTSVSPSADLGRCPDVLFKAVFTAALAVQGIPAALVAAGSVQATQLRAALNYENFFDVSGGYSVTIPGFQTARSTLTGAQFAAWFQAVSTNGYHIPLPNCVLPPPPPHKRAEKPGDAWHPLKGF